MANQILIKVIFPCIELLGQPAPHIQPSTTLHILSSIVLSSIITNIFNKIHARENNKKSITQ